MYMTNDNFAILTTFIIYGMIVLSVAYLVSKFTADLSDYLLAGRSLNGLLTALGVGASDMSSWLLMAVPGSVYLYGISFIWVPISLSIGAYFNWRVISARLRIYTEIAGDSFTLPTYLSNRFKDNSNKIRVVSAVAIIIFFTFYSVTGFVSGALLLELIFDMDYFCALIIMAIIIVTYTAVGGFLAVNWLDLFQGTLMLFALILVPLVTFDYLGGIVFTFDKISDLNPILLNPFNNVKTLGVISLLGWGFGYFGQPHILSRFMAIRSHKELPVARRICMTWMVLALCGAVLIGLVGFVYFIDNPIDNPETIFIVLSRELFNPWITGILLSAILSAIMSTVSALLLISSSALVEDIYHNTIDKKNKYSENKKYIFLNKIAVCSLALVAILIAMNPNTTIMSSVAFAWSGLGASFGPVIILSLFWPRMTRTGAILGILSGCITVLIWKIAEIFFLKEVILQCGILPGFEIIPGFIISILFIIKFSLSNKQELSQQIIKEFAHLERSL